MDKENIEFDENTCRICKIKSNTEAVVRSDSPWIGCCQERCDYWLQVLNLVKVQEQEVGLEEGVAPISKTNISALENLGQTFLLSDYPFKNSN